MPSEELPQMQDHPFWDHHLHVRLQLQMQRICQRLLPFVVDSAVATHHSWVSDLPWLMRSM